MKLFELFAHMPNKPLVPTRNGEAPLLAAYPRRLGVLRGIQS
jgi:hypothetical protein